jgi:RNA polymerase sigma-70 factor (ECF subfamily)
MEAVAAVVGTVTDRPEDEQLALAARTDLAAFGLLYERHVESVFRFLRARGASEDEAADLAAVTFERALSAIHRYRPQGAGFPAWVLRIARNAAIDAARTRRHEPLDVMVDAPAVGPDESPETAAIAREDRDRVRILIAALPEAQRDALALRYGTGLSPGEVALVIGKSEGATKKLLTRALGRLREDWRDDDR